MDEADKGATWIEWGWTNPSYSDLNHTEVYVNGVKAEVNAPGNSYNATGLSPGTTYEIGTRTVDDLDTGSSGFIVAPTHTPTPINYRTVPVITPQVCCP